MKRYAHYSSQGVHSHSVKRWIGVICEPSGGPSTFDAVMNPRYKALWICSSQGPVVPLMLSLGDEQGLILKLELK